MFLVGLTGGIASGKSSVSSVFQELGCPVVDADKFARQVVEPGKPAWKQIVKHFGKDVLLPDGNLDRPKLGEIIFNDATKRKLLNSCTHPYIQRAMIWEVFSYLFQGHNFIILDVPLLLQGSALRKVVSKVVVVFCDEETQLRRLMSRNNLTDDEARCRIQAQLPLSQKCQVADHVIDNSRTREETRQSVISLHRELTSSRRHWKVRGGLLLVGLSFVGMLIFFVRFFR